MLERFVCFTEAFARDLFTGNIYLLSLLRLSRYKFPKVIYLWNTSCVAILPSPLSVFLYSDTLNISLMEKLTFALSSSSCLFIRPPVSDSHSLLTWSSNGEK